MAGPLDGVRVLEFGQAIAAPLGCQLLADLGAEVIKVEPVGGESWRLNAPFLPFESKAYQSLNRGKQSLAIDLRAPEGTRVIHRLVPGMDVVVINYRPDVAAQLGIDYETLSRLRPDLVYVDSTAFGRAGEMALEPGYDIVVQAVSGLLTSAARVDESGVPLATSPAVADTTTGYAICAGVCAALFFRSRTGMGQKVETSLLINALTIQTGGGGREFAVIPAADAPQREAFVARLAEARQRGARYSEQLALRDEVYRANPAGNFYYRCFLTSDGVIAIGALSASLREKVRRVLGIEHNRDQPGYNPRDPDQQARDREVTARVEALIAARDTAYWEQTFREAGVPVSRVNFVQEMAEHPQVLANGYVVELEHDLAGPQKLAAPPWKMSVSPPWPRAASPPLGRDTRRILSGLGYGEEEIADLVARGIVRAGE